MRVQVSEPDLVADLHEYLRRCNCAVELRGATVLEATPTDGDREPAHVRLELDAYLRVWRALHPGAMAVIADGRPDRGCG